MFQIPVERVHIDMKISDKIKLHPNIVAFALVLLNSSWASTNLELTFFPCHNKNNKKNNKNNNNPHKNLLEGNKQEVWNFAHEL